MNIKKLLIPIQTFLLFIFFLNSAVIYLPAQNSAFQGKTYKFVNGQWFDGKKFRRRDFYSVHGYLDDKQPETVDEIIDLKNGYIIPPFADAHCHHFDTPYNINQQIDLYLRDGVFYAAVQSNVRSGALKIADKINKPESIDVSYAHGALTPTFGHGIEVYETLALRLIPTTDVIEANKTKIANSRLRENDAYYIIDSKEDLENKWQKIIEGKPDFIKINLLYSDKFEDNLRKIPDIKLGHIGLNPRLIPLIVQKAHTAGLRVSAHLENMSDYRIALTSGVDIMAHLPGYYFGINENENDYRLTEKDIRETLKRNVWIIPTPSLPDSFKDSEQLNRVEKIAIQNLNMLKKNHARIAFGADAYMSTPIDYVLYINQLGVFSNLEMLKIWSEDTPQLIFPNRKIGHLKKGYEASFLVLNENPLKDFRQVKNIRSRFKQGYFLNSIEK